jgi:hypothetical protein
MSPLSLSGAGACKLPAGDNAAPERRDCHGDREALVLEAPQLTASALDPRLA